MQYNFAMFQFMTEKIKSKQYWIKIHIGRLRDVISHEISIYINNLSKTFLSKRIVIKQQILK